MKKPDIGQTIGLLANLGVIAGIIFLGVELHQNNELMEAEARAARADRLRATAEHVFIDQAFADLLVKAGNQEALTDSERLRVRSFNLYRLRGLEAYFVEYQAGVNPTPSVDGWNLAFHAKQWSGPSLAETWDEVKPQLGDEFVAWMEDNIVER